MLLWDTLRTAWRALAANPLRTILTTLGMIIGVASVVTMLALGEGARAGVEAQIRALGTNLLTVRPGMPRRGPVRVGNVETLIPTDAEAIAGLDGVAAVAPQATSQAQVKYLANNLSCQVIGTSPEYLTIHSHEVASGAPFTFLDVDGRGRVAVIGANVATTLFGTMEAVGERVQIAGQTFRVVGVLAGKGDAGFLSPDDMVLVPVTTHMGPLFGGTSLDAVSVQVVSEDRMDEVKTAIEGLLRLRHRIPLGSDDDFHVRSQTEMLETMGQITGTFTILLGGVAAVSLLVGGIGIMNIMLVSVRERTREIGVRKAVGARRRDILLQFLVESVIVSSAGGLAGLALGWGGALLVAKLAQWPTVVPVYAVVLAVSVSVGVGLVFGVGPANRAARLDPVDALRQE
jgi:putative ABC transport system permease protein